ncbi:MAG: IPT/TIG domain-containing protein, partial [Chloroflexota bacterium]
MTALSACDSTPPPPTSAPTPTAGIPSAAEGITYVHDPLGRLVAVIDPAQGVARYVYDAVGNITAIQRPSLDSVAVLEFSPEWGPAGTQVTVFATGLGAAGSNTVTIGGSNAAIVEASANRLVVEIPAGAGSGPVTLTTPRGTATSERPFEVGDRTPSITSISPQVVSVGDTITLTGARFELDPLDNDVVLNHTRARVNSVTATTLEAVLAAETGSGRVSIATPWGQADGPDLFVVPAPYEPGQVDRTSRIDPASSGTVTFSAGRIALVAIAGQRGHRVTLEITNATGATPSLMLYDVHGRVVPRPINFLAETPEIQLSGSYTLVVDGLAAAESGSFSLAVSEVEDTAASAVVDGPPVLVPVARPGQHADVEFSGLAGQSVVVSIRSASSAGLATVTDPFGAVLANLPWTASGEAGPATLAEVRLTADGRHSIELDPDVLGIGEIEVTVTRPIAEAEGSIDIDGPSVTLTTTAVGQNARVTFAGSAGVPISAHVTAASGCFDAMLSDGAAELARTRSCDGGRAFLEPIELPADGDYSILLDGEGNAIGAVTVSLYGVPLDATAEVLVGGDPTPFTIDVPGQKALLTFAGQAGRRYRLTVSGSTIGGATLVVKGPDEGDLAIHQFALAGVEFDFASAGMDGIYTIHIDPTGDMVGAASVRIEELPTAVAAVRVERAASLAARLGISRTGIHLAIAPSFAPRSACASTLSPVARAEAMPTSWRPREQERWIPTAQNLAGDWTTHREPSPWEWTSPLFASPGLTAVAGRVLRLDGLPLAGVELSVGLVSTCTDESGRFLLGPLQAGAAEMTIDGRPAGRADRQYGQFEVAINAQAGVTSVLPFTVWMPLLDTEHETAVPAVRDSVLVVQSPHLPGLELRLSQGSSLSAPDGEPVSRVGLTPVPLDRPPFPLPIGVSFPMYFTIQPHGALVSGPGAKVVYPNLTRLPQGQRVGLWYYEVDEGWERYGGAVVSELGRAVVPEAGVSLDEFVPASMDTGWGVPASAPPPGQVPAGTAGEPVDLATGLFVDEMTDLLV